MEQNAVDVSIVVCTYNRAPLLRDALASLKALETDGAFRYEIVVTDNASTDESAAVIEEAARDSPVPVRGVREPRPGVAHARNRGIQETRAPWIAFFDDDQVADPGWLKELLAVARETGARWVGGANRLLLPRDHQDDLAGLCRGMLGETTWGDAPCPFGTGMLPGSGNLLVQRSVFEEIGGFDESRRMAGEDGNLFCRMAAANIGGWYAPRAVMRHVVPAYRLTDDYLRWKSLGYGRNLAQRNWCDRGWLAVLLLLVGRLGHALLVSVPRLLWARLRGATGQAQAARCLIWRAQGYARFTLHLLAPKLFAQRDFLARLEFRCERELFGPVANQQ